MKPDNRVDSIIISVGLTIVAVIFVYGTQVYFVDRWTFNKTAVSALYSGIAIIPVLLILYFQKRHQADQQSKQLELQIHAVSAMRAQRHDIINELTLVSAYIQTGKLDKARECVKFISAELSDKYNHETLPRDAWITVISEKQKQAQANGIGFGVTLSSTPPATVDEQRLLPKVLANLIDNAFEASSKAIDPWVQLDWYRDSGRRILSVRNNGPVISDYDAEKIFEPGYSSKEGESHGWGLAICKRVAGELGGILELIRNDNIVEFRLTLPPVECLSSIEAACSDSCVESTYYGHIRSEVVVGKPSPQRLEEEWSKG